MEFLHLEYANQHEALCAGLAAAPDLALLGRGRRRRAAAFARLRPVGQGATQGGPADPRLGGRTAEPLRAARGARRPCVRVLGARLRDVRRVVPVRRDARPGGGDRRRDRRHDVRQADGPARLRRRGLRQDRSRVARGVHRGDGRQAGRAARADDAAGRAAHADLRRPLRRLAGARSRSCRASARRRKSPRPSRASTTARSTSSSARTSCCRRTCASRGSAS